MSDDKRNGCFVNLVQSMDHGYRTGDWVWYHKVAFSPNSASLQDLFQALDDLGHDIYKRLQAIPEIHNRLEKMATPLAAPPSNMPDEGTLRLQALNVALSRSKGEPVDMAIIAADKILQFLKGQMLTNGTQVH